jgi:hypothetical protein
VLLIRDEQMQAFEEALGARFLRELLSRLRGGAHPLLEPLSDGEALALLHRIVTDAEGYGLTELWDVQRFAEYRLCFGEEFERRDWVAAILHQMGVSGTERMDRVEQEGARRELAARSAPC